METTVKLLQTYSGRDKIMRTAGYVAMLLSGAADGKAARKLGTVSSQISAARVILRLFDDLPMLCHVMKYGTGSHEKDPVTRLLSLIGNLSGMVFFPIEHIAWASDQKILSLRNGSARWWTAGIVCWNVSLVTGILKSLRAVGRLRHKRAKLLKQRKLESPEKGDASSASYKAAMRELAMQEKMEYLLLLKNGADLLNAVNWLPKGILWSGRFNTTQCGFFGTIASIVGILTLLQNTN